MPSTRQQQAERDIGRAAEIVHGKAASVRGDETRGGMRPMKTHCYSPSRPRHCELPELSEEILAWLHKVFAGFLDGRQPGHERRIEAQNNAICYVAGLIESVRLGTEPQSDIGASGESKEDAKTALARAARETFAPTSRHAGNRGKANRKFNRVPPEKKSG